MRTPLDEDPHKSRLRRRRAAALIGAGAVLFTLRLLFNASYHVWWGGWSAGPRHLIPGLVLLAPLVALGFSRFPRIGMVLLTISVANQLAISTVLIQVDADLLNPLLDAIYPAFHIRQF